jgi:hypothetical protein
MGVKLFPSKAEVRNEWKRTSTIPAIARRCAQFKTETILIFKGQISFF